MVTVLTEEQIALQKEQEARSFIGRNGLQYVRELATEEEKKYFEGTLYHSGIPILSLLSYLTSTVDSF